jgi:biopolymer transport protein ExbD
VKFGKRRRQETQLILTSLIDVMFTILLFFMVSTEFVADKGKSAEAGVQVDLPRANSQMMLDEVKDLRITVTAAGEVSIDGALLDRDALRQRLRATAAQDPNTLIVLKADSAAAHGKVVEVMDLARDVGLARLAIATDPKNGAAAP